MKKYFHNYVSIKATIFIALFAAVPTLSADVNPFKSGEPTVLKNTKRPSVQGRCGMCGGAMQGRCGGMMDGMMMGGAMPRSSDQAGLPEPDSAGAKLVGQYCIQCHGLPDPEQHSPGGWPGTVARMNTRMQWMSSNNSPMNIVAPTEEELATLTAYLIKHATSEEGATP